MLEHIDTSLESFLRARVPLDPAAIDLSFDAPDREWSAKLTRPTVNVFLWDIRQSAERSQGGLKSVVRNGQRAHEAPAPVIELRYVITAWADARDERPLLSGLTRALLGSPSIPREHLHPAIAHLDEPTLALARSGEDHMDVFKAVEGQVKPGLNAVITTQFETDGDWPIAPPVTAVGLEFNQRWRRVAGEIADARQRGAVGAVVRSGAESTRTDATGRFVIRASYGDEITVEANPPLVVTVPAEGGVKI